MEDSEEEWTKGLTLCEAGWEAMQRMLPGALSPFSSVTTPPEVLVRGKGCSMKNSEQRGDMSKSAVYRSLTDKSGRKKKESAGHTTVYLYVALLGDNAPSPEQQLYICVLVCIHAKLCRCPFTDPLDCKLVHIWCIFNVPYSCD